MSERHSAPLPEGSQGSTADHAPAGRLRDQHGAVTRRVILGAARKRFGERGYAGTSVKQIANEAGVAVQTLYSAFGSKSGVLRGLIDLIDEEADVIALFEAMMTAEDPRDALALFARIRRQIRERCGDIVAVMRAGARIDADIGTAWAEGMRRRHTGIARMVARLADAGWLRPDVDSERAADVIAALATDDVCDVLVEQRGWRFEEYETWLRDTMRTLVLDAEK
jgi:AcrR family transcriptional regulator